MNNLSLENIAKSQVCVSQVTLNTVQYVWRYYVSTTDDTQDEGFPYLQANLTDTVPFSHA